MKVAFLWHDINGIRHAGAGSTGTVSVMMLAEVLSAIETSLA